MTEGEEELVLDCFQRFMLTPPRSSPGMMVKSGECRRHCQSRHCPPLSQRHLVRLRNIAVPVVAGLRPALHRFPVDLHQTEMLGVAEPPFEVVEQGPDEIALEVDAVLDGAMTGQQMVADVEDPTAVLRLAGRTDPVAV